MDNIKIFWDDVNKIPRILNEINDMELITKEKLRYLAPDLRPVFYQEKKLLRLLFDELDEKIMYQSVWVSKQGKYYIISDVFYRFSSMKKIFSYAKP